MIFAVFSSKTIYANTGASYNLTDTSETNKNRIHELLLENSLEDSEDSKLLDYLDDLEKNPFDINSVTIEELETIPFISANLANEIIIYRNENYPLRSKRQLLNISGFNEDIYEFVKNFFTVKRSNNENQEEVKIKSVENKNEKFRFLKNLEIRFRTRFQQDLQTKEGFINGEYPGSKAKIFNQLRLNYAKENYSLTGNISIEKDPGENSLADFYSGFIELKNFKNVRKVVIGDYSLLFGQGLGMWSGLGFQKGNASVDPIKKRAEGINGYSSVNESQFFRGGAINFANKYIDLFLFFSNNYFDASIDTTLDEISSFYFDGYHRTISEQKRDNAVKEFLYGSRLYFNKDNFRVGLTYWGSTFSKYIGSGSTRQLYNFTGEKANVLSLDYDFLYKNINFYGEFARSQTGAMSGLGATRFSVGKIINLVFLYRNYPEDFSPLHSFGFGENNGDTKNESGLYSGISINPIKGLQINAYFDQFKFPYRTFTNPGATTGNDFLTFVNWEITKNLTLNFKYKNKNKEEARTTTDEFGRFVKKIDNRNQMNFRIGFVYEIINTVRVRSRYDYVFVDYKYFGGNNKGALFYSDINITPVEKLFFSTRIIFFDTEDYDSRLYEYEDDIQGVMSNVGLYGKGRRWYMMIKYNVYNQINLYGKYAETYYDNVKAIGSGNDLIKGNLSNKLNIGVEINF